MTRNSWRRRPGRESVRKRIGRHRARAIHARDAGRCVYCLSPRELTLDHLTPRSKGGTDDPENLVTACLSCNSARQDKSMAAWARYFTTWTGMKLCPRKVRRHAKKIYLYL